MTVLEITELQRGSGVRPAPTPAEQLSATPSYHRRVSVPPWFTTRLLSLQRAIAVALVIAQGGIAVTGSIVRVTGSGLGCPTWPQCFPGSLVPTPHPEVAALHQYVEFGN